MKFPALASCISMIRYSENRSCYLIICASNLAKATLCIDNKKIWDYFMDALIKTIK